MSEQGARKKITGEFSVQELMMLLDRKENLNLEDGTQIKEIVNHIRYEGNSILIYVSGNTWQSPICSLTPSVRPDPEGKFEWFFNPNP